MQSTDSYGSNCDHNVDRHHQVQDSRHRAGLASDTFAESRIKGWQAVALRRSGPPCYRIMVSDTAEPTDVVTSSASTDEYLLRRQMDLQEEARDVLNELDLERRLGDIGSMLMTGSFISGLMVWRELDIMFLGGPELSPTDVLAAMGQLVLLPGIVRFDYADERGLRSPTGEPRDERYHVPTTYIRPSGTWCLDLTFWLHDAHENVTAWHEQLRDSLTPEERGAILRIKNVWHRRPEYPGVVSGLEIYTSVLEHGVRSLEQFDVWLAGAS